MTMYTEWLTAKHNLDVAKATELKLRNKICKRVLEEKMEGSTTVRRDNLKITATARLVRTLDREMLDVLWGDLSQEEQDCIDYQPKLLLAPFRRIEETGGKLMEAVTTKPGQASLKIESYHESNKY